MEPSPTEPGPSGGSATWAGFWGGGCRGSGPRACRGNAGGGPSGHPRLFLADRLLSLTLLAFENLNTATCKDRCLACIEEPFFSPLWPLLLALYRYTPSPPATPDQPWSTARSS